MAERNNQTNGELTTVAQATWINYNIPAATGNAVGYEDRKSLVAMRLIKQ